MKKFISKKIFSHQMSFVFIGLIFASSSFAQSTYFSELVKTISRVGVQANAYYYVSFNEGFGQNCLYGIGYITEDRKALYAQILGAKLSNKKLSRVDYSQPGGNGTQCFIELAEVTE